MARITINILRNDIYVIAEGISVMVSQHNGGTPTYEQLWASPEESKKLDIYYREAVSDLERRLTEWIQQTSGQYNLTQEGGNYTLSLAMSPHWPVNMQGLLANKIQDYLVHAVTAGWLNDFDGLTIKQDYQAMSAQDIADIRGIICLRAFGFSESERADDAAVKDDSTVLTPSERGGDGTTKDDSTAFTPSERSDDGTVKDDSAAFTPSARGDDGTTKDDGSIPTPSERGTDSTKKDDSEVPTPSERGDDDTTKDDSDTPTASERGYDSTKKDDSEVPTSSERGDDGTTKDDSDTPTASERGTDSTKKDDSAVLKPSERGDDGATKDDSATPTSSERNSDGKTKDDSEVPASSERGSDSTKKDDSAVPTPSERGDDGATKDDSGALTPGARQADVEKEQPMLRPEAGYRRNDNVIRTNSEPVSCIDNLRHRDNDIVEHHSDYTDWSGTGMNPHAVQLCHDARRVQKGRGFTPSPFDRCHKKPVSHPPIPPKPHHKDPRIPDFPTHPNYPPIVANGKGWSDEPLYDAEGSEHFVNDHVSPINTNNYE